ncbi:MAG: Guanine deaminase [candidate division WS6 bacterium OLB20]|uniref:Guanine deaminase n=1 Tax=candidate division WS6 bacterium OLB20 TaxID=1617426 RepID=A0A136LZ69_9BACT|nr:MAG: Guanine deaminase [candidate division WS6 bacterium OLB20]
MTDSTYIKHAIELSRKSVEQGRFPAGALVVKNGAVISESTSGLYPGYNHADGASVDKAFRAEKADLRGAVLFCSMFPCVMCLTKAYWAGIRRIVFAIPRSDLNQEYYESASEPQLDFHEQVELVHSGSMRDKAMEVVRSWEKSR